ncbi:MAG TPA: tetraacyldisaccharide 4'-kinase [Gemmatimonadales bacterium]|nr:tetraacyldisaccharide 4'-kinase [Gemmatimonadales bacterium]
MNGASVVQWLWGGTSGARLARLPLIPLAFVYGGTMRVRASAYRHGWLATARLPLPSVAVGNLSVGGAGKTPLAAWIAARFADRGIKPGILLRGYGADEPLVLARLVPGAVVVTDPDRMAGAARARAAGAGVLVLDDAFQHLRVTRDLNIAVVSAESAEAAPWTLPAGPWRESRHALGRADWLVVTRKRSSPDAAAALVERLSAGRRELPLSVAHLALAGFEGMQTGEAHPLGVIAGGRVLAAAGIADPASFAAQLAAQGASVQLMAYQDHHAYTAADVGALVRAGASADYVVVTEKDAVKLRHLWPRDTPEPLVAQLHVSWERNGALLERALDAAGAREPLPRSSE